MTYYYKRLDKDGRIIMIGTQSFPVTPNTELGNEEITEEEYNVLMEEIKTHSANVQDYVNKVKAGEITLEDVPTDYRSEVEAIITSHEFVVNDFVEKVLSGEITIEQVPDELKAEVTEKVQSAEPPNNPYGIPNAKYEEIRQGVVNEIVEGVKQNGEQTEPTV